MQHYFYKYARTFVIVVMSLTLLHCSHSKSVKSSQNIKSDDVFAGESSWYGQPFNGRKTASGERYNMYALTAAHRTLPFGTMLEITNLENDKKVIVKVNDRGPYVGARVLDLSYGAAKQLGFAKLGTTGIRARILKQTEAD